MTTPDRSIRTFYAGWGEYNAQIISTIGAMTNSQLQIRPASERWPIWATVGHMAGAREYWLCDVLGEPLADIPVIDPETGMGWEDDLDKPRNADELAQALESTWRLIEGCLERWTPSMLDERFDRAGTSQVHTRQAVLMRMLSHDAYHCGEISQTLGIEGLPQIDLWPPGSRQLNE